MLNEARMETTGVTTSATPTSPGADGRARLSSERVGILLVFSSALIWSFGGTIGRFVEHLDSWTVVFWRSFWAVAFLLAFMAWRDGVRGTLALFRGMGLPGLVVAACFATASTCFVVALSYTSVANILLMQAGAPLFAALIAWAILGEQISRATWAAIAAVIAGVAIMVSKSFDGTVSPIGDGLALTTALVFAVATVITRRYAHVRMTPATCLGAGIAGAISLVMAPTLSVSLGDTGFLFAFGALNLGLGLALFASGARLIPAAIAALLGTFETLLGPIWVWLVHSEVPNGRTLMGGAVVLAALVFHIGMEFRRQSRPARPGTTGFPQPS